MKLNVLSGGLLKQWQQINIGKLWTIHEKSYRKVPSEWRIGETCFTSIAVIGEKLYINHPKNINHVLEYSKDLMSVIITIVTIYKWRGHMVLLWSLKNKLRKKITCPKTFTWENIHRSIWYMIPWRFSLENTQSCNILYSYQTFFCISYIMGANFITNI